MSARSGLYTLAFIASGFGHCRDEIMTGARRSERGREMPSGRSILRFIDMRFPRRFSPPRRALRQGAAPAAGPAQRRRLRQNLAVARRRSGFARLALRQRRQHRLGSKVAATVAGARRPAGHPRSQPDRRSRRVGVCGLPRRARPGGGGFRSLDRRPHPRSPLALDAAAGADRHHNPRPALRPPEASRRPRPREPA